MVSDFGTDLDMVLDTGAETMTPSKLRRILNL